MRERSGSTIAVDSPSQTPLALLHVSVPEGLLSAPASDFPSYLRRVRFGLSNYTALSSSRSAEGNKYALRFAEAECYSRSLLVEPTYGASTPLTNSNQLSALLYVKEEITPNRLQRGIRAAFW